MSSDIIRNNGVNGTGTLREGPSPGRCPVGEPRRPGRHQKTARSGWSKEMNVAVMECYFLSRPFDEEGKPIRIQKVNAQHVEEKTGFESNKAKVV